MVLLVMTFHPLKNLKSHLWTRLFHHHRLETAAQGLIFLDILAILIQGCRTNQLQLPTRQSWLKNICRIHRTLTRACTGQQMQLVNEQNHIIVLYCLVNHAFNAFLKFTPKFSARHHRRQVHLNNPLTNQYARYVIFDHAFSQTFHNGSFTYTSFTNQHRIRLGTATQNCHYTLNFALTPNHRVQLILFS